MSENESRDRGPAETCCPARPLTALTERSSTSGGGQGRLGGGLEKIEAAMRPAS